MGCTKYKDSSTTDLVKAYFNYVVSDDWSAAHSAAGRLGADRADDQVRGSEGDRRDRELMLNPLSRHSRAPRGREGPASRRGALPRPSSTELDGSPRRNHHAGRPDPGLRQRRSQAARRPDLLQRRRDRRGHRPRDPGRGRALPDHQVRARRDRQLGRAAGGQEPDRLHRATRLRHRSGRRCGSGHRGAARRRRRPLHQPHRAAADREHPRLHRRPARRDPEHRLRALGDLRARPGDGPDPRLARRQAQLHPLLRGARVGDGKNHAHRRPGAGGDDPADHLRGRQGGLRPDARARTRRRRSLSVRRAGR